MTIKHNVAGVWKTNIPKINVAGTWKTPSAKINVAGTWKAVGKAAEFNTNGDSNFRLLASCYAGLQINSSGSEYEYLNTGGTTNIGTWLKSGAASAVWVECVLVSGSWNSINAGTGTRLQCSTTRSWRIVQTSSGTRTVTCNFKFWDASSGGNLIDETGNISFVAEYGV